MDIHDPLPSEYDNCFSSLKTGSLFMFNVYGRNGSNRILGEIKGGKLFESI
jgi:hypothetical protein